MPAQMTADLQRTLTEQKLCRDYLDQNGYDPGAFMGLCDWASEEILIRLEEGC